MDTPNVFIHMDNSVSAPMCQLGRVIVYRWAQGNNIIMEGTCCNSVACTCSNDYPITRKGSNQEKADFYNTLRQMADASLYESSHNL